jgi:hypothetical protein
VSLRRQDILEPAAIRGIATWCRDHLDDQLPILVGSRGPSTSGAIPSTANHTKPTSPRARGLVGPRRRPRPVPVAVPGRGEGTDDHGDPWRLTHPHPRRHQPRDPSTRPGRSRRRDTGGIRTRLHSTRQPGPGYAFRADPAPETVIDDLMERRLRAAAHALRLFHSLRLHITEDQASEQRCAGQASSTTSAPPPSKTPRPNSAAWYARA